MPSYLTKRYSFGIGEQAFSISDTFSENGSGVLNWTLPYKGDEFGIVPFRWKPLPTSYSWMVKYGTPGNIVSVLIKLECSLDGTNWFTVDSHNTNANTLKYVVDKPVRFLRAIIDTGGLDLTSSTSTTIQVSFSM